MSGNFNKYARNCVQMNISNTMSPIIVALDYSDMSQALNMARNLDPRSCRVKVGKELFTRCGPKIIEELHLLGFEVFLDLKFHDIPNTTANAVGVAAEMGVWMVNVHASGGRRMLEACVEKLCTFKQKPLLIGVTVLTSMESKDLLDVGISDSPWLQVNRLSGLCLSSGLDGVVCSSQEVVNLKKNYNDSLKLITPGIRPIFSEKGDQRRVMTPSMAKEAGSDYLVIGRPITQAKEPLKALDMIQQELGFIQSV